MPDTPILTPYRCPECGAIRINLVAGRWSVCPNGHGRLYPPIRRRDVAKTEKARWLASIPVATLVEIRVPYARKPGERIVRAYRVGGQEGLWRFSGTRRIHSLVEPTPGQVFARLKFCNQWHVLQMKRARKIERLAAKGSE